MPAVSGEAPSIARVALERSGRLDDCSPRGDIRCGPLASTVKGEPSPALVDGAVREHRGAGAGVVIAVGGGSVLDAGKAVSAMLPVDGSVLDFLEEVGDALRPQRCEGAVRRGADHCRHRQRGDEERGAEPCRSEGFQGLPPPRRFVPDVAVVDPALALTCPAGYHRRMRDGRPYATARVVRLTGRLPPDRCPGIERV